MAIHTALPDWEQPPSYIEIVPGHWMTLDDIRKERQWFTEELERERSNVRNLERQLAAARKTNMTLTDNLLKKRALLEWVGTWWGYRLDKWCRIKRQLLSQWFSQWGWRLHDAWEVLNGRYSG